MRQQGLARTRGTEEQDVRLAQLDVVGPHLGVDALVMVVDGDGKNFLRTILADDVVVQNGLDVDRLGHRGQTEILAVLLDLLCDDVVTQADALIADVDGGASDEFLDLFLSLSAERAGEAGLVFAPGR